MQRRHRQQLQHLCRRHLTMHSRSATSSTGSASATRPIRLSFSSRLLIASCARKRKTDLSRHSQGPTHQQALSKKEAKGDKKRDAVGGNDDVVGTSKAKRTNKQELDVIEPTEVRLVVNNRMLNANETKEGDQQQKQMSSRSQIIP